MLLPAKSSLWRTKRLSLPVHCKRSDNSSTKRHFEVTYTWVLAVGLFAVPCSSAEAPWSKESAFVVIPLAGNQLSNRATPMAAYI